MKMIDFKKSQQLAEALPFEVLLTATFMACTTLDAGDKLKEAFPKEWEDLFRMMIAEKMIKVEDLPDEKSDC